MNHPHQLHLHLRQHLHQDKLKRRPKHKVRYDLFWLNSKNELFYLGFLISSAGGMGASPSPATNSPMQQANNQGVSGPASNAPNNPNLNGNQGPGASTTASPQIYGNQTSNWIAAISCIPRPLKTIYSTLSFHSSCLVGANTHTHTTQIFTSTHVFGYLLTLQAFSRRLG